LEFIEVPLFFRPIYGCGFGVFKFLFAAPVTALLDESAGAVEFLFAVEVAGAVEVDSGQMQPHGPSKP